MDPTETLQRIRELLVLIPTTEGWHADNITELTDLVEALDGWMARGGFLPAQWERKS